MTYQPSISRRPALIAVLLAALLAALLPAANVAAAHITLTFDTQPGDGTGGSPLSMDPVVHADDGADVPGLAVTIEIHPNWNPSGGILTCTSGLTVVTDAFGDATFAGCEIDKAGANYRLRASAAHASNVRSDTFNVTVGPAHHLKFTSYPATNTQALLDPQPSVAVVDEGGNTVTGDTRSITLSTNQNAGTFSCTGGLTRAAVGGVAAFTGCQQTTVASGYTLTATTTGLSDNTETGPPFNVVSGIATKLLLCWGSTTGSCNTTPPTSSTGGLPFPTQPHVRIADSGNTTVTSDDTTVVTLAKTPGTPTAGGPGTLACTGGLSKTATDGIAQFAGCNIDKAGTGYRLRATSAPALTLADSNAFNVAVGPAAKLGFLTQPTTGNAGQTLSPNITVAIQDAGGNTVTSGQTANVSLAINPNPSGAVLSCTGGTTMAAANGVATFTGCQIDRAGSFLLAATASNAVPAATIAAATSAAIVISAVQAVISLFASSPVITWGNSVVFSIQFGPNGANRAFTMQASPDGLNWTTIITPVLMTNASGQGSFAYTPIRNYYYRAVFAGAPDLSAAMSNVQRVVVRQIALLRPTNLGAVDHIGVGTTIRFTTTVRPARPELPKTTVSFVVYRLIGRTWTLAATRDVVIDSAGLAAVDVTFSQPGKWYVRSIARPTTVNANSVWSPVERYDVP